MRAATKRSPAGAMLALTTADLMKSPVVTIRQNTPLREAARLLARADISGAPVVDAGGFCVGVLSSSDFVTWAGSEGNEVSFIAPWGEMINVEDAPDNEMRHYMTVRPVTVAPATPIADVARMMVEAHIHRVLVVAEHGPPSGIVTSTDVLAAVADAARE